MRPLRLIIRAKPDQATKDGTYNIKVRVTHKGKAIDIRTDYYVREDQFEKGTIVNHGSAMIWNGRLRNLLTLYEHKIDKLGLKVENMDCRAVVNYLRQVDQKGRDPEFFFMAENIIGSMKESGQTSYSNTITQTISALKSFSGSNLHYVDITPEYLTRFEKYLKRQGMAPTTIGIHLRNIRMIYNRAIDAGKADLSDYPFRRFKIRSAPSRDRDMEISDLKMLKDADLKLKSHRRARDLFMLSFYLCGLNFKDMLHIRKEDIKRDRVEINRIKTGQPLSIKIQPEAQEIIDRYQGKEFMIGILEEKLKVARRDRSTIIYKDVTDQTNRALRKISEILEFPYKLSTYYARHTWSSIAFNECGASEEIIALALGHASTRRVTAGYIRKKYEMADRINRQIVDLVVINN